MYFLSVINICKESLTLSKKKKNKCMEIIGYHRLKKIHLSEIKSMSSLESWKTAKCPGIHILPLKYAFVWEWLSPPKWCNPQRKTDRPWDIPKTQMTHKIASNQCNYIVCYPAGIQPHKANAQITALLWAKQEWNVTKIFTMKKSF